MRFASPCCLAAAFLLPAIFLAACQPPVSPFAGAGMDMFAPVSLTLHPLSRMVPSAPPASAAATTTAAAVPPLASGAPSILEARIELKDQFADLTKAPGIVTLELFDQPPLTHKGALIQSWTFSLDTPQENSDHWDRTMRQYLFKLPLIQAGGGLPKREHLLLTATLTLPNGMVLTHEMELAVK
jgi:hypothetical protein